MISKKNNGLDSNKKWKLSKIHNGNKKTEKKLRLYAFRNQSFIKTYHPLKQKKVKLRQLKIITEENLYGGAINSDGITGKKHRYNILCKKYTVTRMDKNPNPEYSDRNAVCEWLLSIGEKISRITSEKYILKDRICLFNSVLIFANKKRIDMGLKPFLVMDIIDNVWE